MMVTAMPSNGWSVIAVSAAASTPVARARAAAWVLVVHAAGWGSVLRSGQAPARSRNSRPVQPCLDGGGELAGLLGGGVVPDPGQQAGGEAFLGPGQEGREGQGRGAAPELGEQGLGG
jgi:hypothetical protein